MRGVRSHEIVQQSNPAMEEKLRKSHEKAKKFTVEPIDQSLYVVRSGATNFTVNFAENTCTCKKFQLDHLPYNEVGVVEEYEYRQQESSAQDKNAVGANNWGTTD
ncbi:hypothetical protein DH2020_039180 [Rehmannia glutinosa]|uniref:Uncharacterized protein n=1 Tax=Rehmannia glutinosa TaxID=99300 RepID=A0ABR0UX80_REHGL